MIPYSHIQFYATEEANDIETLGKHHFLCVCHFKIELSWQRRTLELSKCGVRYQWPLTNT